MILENIQLGVPNIWVVSNDVNKIVDVITSVCDNSLFIMDTEKGFSQYVDGKWKPVLIENYVEEEREEEPYIVVHHPGIAKKWIKDNKEELGQCTLLTILDPLAGKQYCMEQYSHVISNQKKYQDSFWNDSVEDLPVQNIICSSARPPEEFASLFFIEEIQPPSYKELGTIVNHIFDKSEIEAESEDMIRELAQAGAGLDEMTFATLCLKSIKRYGKIDSKFIYDTKMSNVKAHGILEIIQPKISFKDIGGLDNIKDIIQRTRFLRENKKEAESYGVTPIRRMLMVGVPGTGKSAICQATASELDLDLARTGISQVMNKYIGQSEENMRAVFQQIKAMNPLCVWIDEFGRDLSGSGQGADSGTTDRVHGEFLTGLQELPEESFLLCAANELHSLKPEMLRADRFDKIFFVGLPSHEERKHIFRIHLSQIKTDHEYDYDALAQITQFMTGAEIVSLVKETKFYVISETMRPINTSDILNRAPSIKNTIWNKHPEMVRSMYAYAYDQWDWASSAQREEVNYILGKKTSTKSKVSL